MKRKRPHILVLCILAIVLLTGVRKGFQNELIDIRFGWFARQASGDVVLVAINSPSIEKIGVWPWPRDIHAALIDRLESAGVKDLVFDVDFSSASNPASDRRFEEALRKAGGSVVLPAFKQVVDDGKGGKAIYINRPLPQFYQHAWLAIVNVVVEPDGLVRHYPFGEMLDGKFLPSVGALLAGKHASTQDPLRIDFSIQADSLPTVSYVDVLNGEPEALQKVRGKKVLIGATAIELGDRFSVPGGRVISGSQLQILASDSILQGRVLLPTSNYLTLGGAGFILLLMIVLWRRFSAGLRVIILVGMAVAAEAVAILLQTRFAIVLDTSLWHIAVAGYLAATALDEIDFRSLLGGIAEKRFERIAMSIGDGLICADQNGTVTVWNPGAASIFGYTRGEMIGQPLGRVCLLPGADGEGTPIPLDELPTAELQAPGGKVMELQGRRKSGEEFPLEICFSEWQGVDGFQYGAVLRDISTRKREAERIRYLAEHDTLTDLANRNSLYEHLAATLDEAKSTQRSVALLMIDLDKFKQVNDTLGHAFGDQLLCGVAQRLRSLVGADGLVARLSGDEFAVVLGGADPAGRALALAQRICLVLSEQPFLLENRPVRINASIGVALYPEYCATADELFGNADLALYRAKAAGRGRFVRFERKIRVELEKRQALEAELAVALEKGQLELFYQPQVRLTDGELIGAEALIRWRHPERGLVSPADFMPIVNACSMSDRIGHWVMTTACRQGRAWQETGNDLHIAINLSPSQLQSGDLASTVALVLHESGFSPRLLELEVTEDILLDDEKNALETFKRIQGLGVRTAFDDFGTGYGSLSYLKKFPLDKLKIDRSFVRELRAGTNDAAIVRSTVMLGKLLGMSVIAEGIEDATTAEFLASMGCEHGQGYHFGKPMPAAEFEQSFFTRSGVSRQNHPRSATAA